jgi:ribosomal protein S18 acetylase RimI-like enzyme
MLNLKPMTEDEYSAYIAWVLEDYAREISANFRISMEEARTNSARDIDGILPQGQSTPDHFIYNIELSAQDGETRLGYLWIHVDGDKKRCFIYDIFLHPESRHQGWGRKVLVLLETNMKQQGIRRICLNVFANNHPAQELYSKMGYEFTNMNMQKWLDD